MELADRTRCGKGEWPGKRRARWELNDYEDHAALTTEFVFITILAHPTQASSTWPSLLHVSPWGLPGRRSFGGPLEVLG